MKKYQYLGQSESIKEAEDMLHYLQCLREGLKITEALLSVGWSAGKLHYLRRKFSYFDEKCKALMGAQFQPLVFINESFEIIDMGFDGPKYLYFIRAEGSHLIKIGITGNPISRLKSLQGSSPIRLWFDKVIKGGSDYERLIHTHLYHRGFHSHGEWFKAEGFDIAMRLLNEFTKQDMTS